MGAAVIAITVGCAFEGTVAEVVACQEWEAVEEVVRCLEGRMERHFEAA